MACTRRIRCRSARGLTDVLVVLGILAVLGVFIPSALQRARERSRSLRCRQNLEACGKALHAYHAVHSVFPPGIVPPAAPRRRWYAMPSCDVVATAAACDRPDAPRASGLTLMLPYLEEQAAFNGYNVDVACCAFENGTAVSQRIKYYVCPSNQRGDSAIFNSFYLPTQVKSLTGPSPTDYAFSMGGVGSIDCDSNLRIGGGQNDPIPGNMKSSRGLFNVASSTTIDEIRDGTSNTLAMGEACGSPELTVGAIAYDGSIVDGAQSMSVGAYGVRYDNAWAQGFIGSAPGLGKSMNFGGYGSVFAATAWNAWYDTQRQLTTSQGWFGYPPNEGQQRFVRPTYFSDPALGVNLTGSNGGNLPGSVGSVQGFRSYHPGGVWMLMADGSVRYFSNDVDLKTWVALSTIRGREQVDLQ